MAHSSPSPGKAEAGRALELSGQLANKPPVPGRNPVSEKNKALEKQQAYHLPPYV